MVSRIMIPLRRSMKVIYATHNATRIFCIPHRFNIIWVLSHVRSPLVPFSINVINPLSLVPSVSSVTMKVHFDMIKQL